MKGFTLVPVLAALALAACSKTENQAYTTPDTKAKAAAYITDPSRLSEKELVERASDAYVFGYPLVLMDVTRETMTSEDAPERGRGPENTLVHSRRLADASFSDVVAPNVDTLYSTAWLDLEEEPMVITVPNTGDRYYVLEILDAWTQVVAAPGSRTTGNDELKFAVVGPGYEGSIPRGVKRIDSPTQLAWLIGRIHTEGGDDLGAVHAIQDEMRMTPLSVYEGEAPPEPASSEGKAKTAPGGEATPPEKVASMSPEAFFSRLNALMAKNPPTREDAPAMARFETLGISPGKPFSLRRHPSEVASAISKGGQQGAARVERAAGEPLGEEKNGWSILRDGGDYRTDYALRAKVARAGLGANLPEDAVYPLATKDADGEPLDGTNAYVIHFEKDEIPEVRAFWSITAYDDEGRLVDNELDRFALGSRDALRENPDGSLTLYLQSEPPGADKKSNWLPIPSGDFELLLRLYWPNGEIVRGAWSPPPVERVRS